MKTNQPPKTVLFFEKKGTTLTANQKKYNELIEDVNLKTKEIELDREYLDYILEFHVEELGPFHERSTRIFVNLAKRFADLIEKGRLKKEQQDMLRKAIRYTYKKVTKLRALTSKEAEFYDKWCGEQRSQMISLDFKDGMELVSMLFSAEFGVDMDLSNVDDSPDGKALFSEKMRDILGFKSLSDFDDGTKPPKPPQIVALYEYLVEQLHEGMILTEDGRVERDDWIRLADHAYEYNNLGALIRLELRCLVTNSDYLESRDQEKVNQYITTLKAQLKELNKTQAELFNLPKYNAIREYTGPGRDRELTTAKITNERLLMQPEDSELTELEKRIRAKDNEKMLMRMAEDMADSR